jgi:tetratricopeptide (TPR) repeat protein
VSKISLRAAFALGQNSPIAAQEVFTNRITEIEAFDGSLRALEDYLRVADMSPVLDRKMPRRNVLVYYGVGGIGKTTLSQELERRFLGPSQGKSQRERAAIRFDFSESDAFDMESVVLRLRAGLGRLSQHWPAFDVALGVYWGRAHPGEPLDEFINRSTPLRRVAHTVGLSEQISSTISDALGAALPGVARAAHALSGFLYREAKKAIVNHRVLKNCELLSALLDADADIETLSYFPYLLAWDLNRLPLPKMRAIALLDTFEEVTSRNTRDMERWLQRAVFLMPNVLFVITGRNRLDWADLERADELDFVGPYRWPYLQAGHTNGEPRQHLVGYLSDTDSNSYLASALTQDGQPAIPAEIRARIVTASGGLPLYLDLAVTLFCEILARGETPVEKQFGQPLPTVCGKILRDLGRDERELMRAAALLDAFSLDMLRAACPNIPDSALLRFRDRPFLEVNTDRNWPYSLHTILRDAIRRADRELRDSWSPRERDEVAARIGRYLGRAATQAADSADRSTQVAAVRQAIELCRLTSQFFAWLPDEAQKLLTCGGWALMPALPDGDGGPVSALILGLRGARERRSGRLDNSIALINEALGRSALPQALYRFLLLHRAHALRVAGRYADGAADYKQLWQTPGEFIEDAGYWLADYSFLQGRFAEALSDLDRLSDWSGDLRGEILRLQGHVHRVNALFDGAEARYRAALELARETGNMAAEGKALTDLVQTLSWCRPTEAQGLQPRALEVNESLRNLVEIVKVHAAMAVALMSLGHLDEADAHIERGLSVTEQCGYPGGRVWCWVARTLTQFKRGDIDASRSSAAHLASIVDNLQGNRFWSEIVNWLIGNDGRLHQVNITEWLDGRDAAKTRWLDVWSFRDRDRG